MIGEPDWNHDGRDWPNRAASRFVRAGGLRWHVQVMHPAPTAVLGDRPPDHPTVLLLHGTGAATHSWRDLMPLLARRFTVVAPDLPGHGFTGSASAAQAGLPGVARAVAALLQAMGVAPAVVVGHSAGAAIGARMILDRRIAPRGLMSLNGALLPIAGPAATLFPAAARLLANTPVMPWLFSVQALFGDPTSRLLANTGSRIDAVGKRHYARLLARPGHVAGALRMMAHWDLQQLDLRQLHVPVLLVIGETDGMVPPADAARLARLLPDARVVRLPGLGHLAHEEAPDRIAALVTDMARTSGRAAALGCDA